MMLLFSLCATTAIQLSTRTSIPNVTPERLNDFLATPANWPRIVLSSWSVDGERIETPFSTGDVVDEFLTPPVWRVRWTCTDRSAESLIFESEGLDGVASDCKMAFSFAEVSGGGAEVELEMSYAPTSPIATLATPILAIDNAIAVKLLLPRALQAGTPTESKLGSTDPIAGPLLAAGRAIGLVPEAEADGWTGEPTAWADADSLTQRLSAFSQRRLGGLKLWAARQVAGEFDADAVDARLDGLLDGSGVVLFSFTSCPFCKRAKELLTAKGASFTCVELDEEADGAAMRVQLGVRTGRTSVPSCWIGAEYVGGMNDGPGLGPLDAEGLLEPKLRAVGAVA